MVRLFQNCCIGMGVQDDDDDVVDDMPPPVPLTGRNLRAMIVAAPRLILGQYVNVFVEKELTSVKSLDALAALI